MPRNRIEDIDYERLASAIARAFSEQGGVIAFGENIPNRTQGKPTILFDDCKIFVFEAGGKQFEFEKVTKQDWVETIKHCERTKTDVSVGYDAAQPNSDKTEKPQELHEVPPP